MDLLDNHKLEDCTCISKEMLIDENEKQFIGCLRHVNSGNEEQKKKPCLVQRASFDNGIQGLVPALKIDRKADENDDVNSELTCRLKAEIVPVCTLTTFGQGSGRRGVTIMMANTYFYIDIDDIKKYPETKLAKMFASDNSDSNGAKLNESNQLDIGYDVSSLACRAVLSFYKSGNIYIPPGVNVHEVRDVADFLLIPFNIEIVHSRNLRDLLHEFSDDGARKKFEFFLEEEILNHMVASANRGDRECHIVILTGEEIIDWDETYPPQMGEEYTKVIKSPSLYRFFKYFENRDVAKVVLKDRFLKKVRLGIEGYPTNKEKVKRRPDGKYDVIYNYVQRPFIHMSWEKEEARSRHVDFQCVKSKSITNLPDALTEVEITPQPDIDNVANIIPQQFEPYPVNICIHDNDNVDG